MKLTDKYYIDRASKYANPLDENAALPIVYGDITDGTAGQWELPCIDTVNFIYCFANHPVLSVPNGNSINIYADDVLVDPANYTFDESNNVETLGAIATIMFTADKGSAVITARGKGKPDATGIVMMRNITEMVDDFLTVWCGFSAAIFDSTRKARASQIFLTQSYQAAGVIQDDVVIWDQIIEMMASFLGSAFLDGAGNLILDIDINTIQGGTTIIPRQEGHLIEVRQRLKNIINQCPEEFAYNYVTGEFEHGSSGSATFNGASQGVYGPRLPEESYKFYWCRDLASIGTLQTLIVAKFKDPLYEIELKDITLKRLSIDVGDTFVYSAKELYDKYGLPLLNHYWKTISVKPDFSKSIITFRALQTPFFMTTAYLADGGLGSYTSVTLTAAASGSSGITVTDDPDIDVGTGDFTLVWKGSLPDWTPAAVQTILTKWVANVGIDVAIRTDGSIQFYRNLSFSVSSVLGFVNGSEHEITITVVRETAIAAGEVRFYKDGVLLGNPVAIPAGAPPTYSNAANLQILGYTDIRYAGTAIHTYMFNRALSAAEALSLHNSGIAAGDRWGNQTTPTPGCVLALEATGIHTAGWEDSSSNGLNAAYPATGWTLGAPVNIRAADGSILAGNNRDPVIY